MRPRLEKVSLIYAPLHIGGAHRGASLGPGAIKVAELSEKIQKMGLKVDAEIEIAVPAHVGREREGSNARYVEEIETVCASVAQSVETAMEAGSIPITIGGDHSLAIGSIAGVASYYRKQMQNWGLIWYDAHGDVNTPETSRSGNVHGMPLAVSVGVGDERLTNLMGFAPKADPERSVLIGIRDVDPPEQIFIRESGISAFTMRDVDRLGMTRVTESALEHCGSDIEGIHVSFDLDVIDPDEAPGVSTAARGGLSYRESAASLEILAETGMIRSLDIMELNPARDIKNATARLAVRLALCCLGKSIL